MLHPCCCCPPACPPAEDQRKDLEAAVQKMTDEYVKQVGVKGALVRTLPGCALPLGLGLCLGLEGPSWG